MRVRFVSHYYGAEYLLLELDVPCLPPKDTSMYLPGTGSQQDLFLAPFNCGNYTYIHGERMFVIDDDGGLDLDEFRIPILVKHGWRFSLHPFEQDMAPVTKISTWNPPKHKPKLRS